MTCPKCYSDSTQRFKIIYESGTHRGEHYSSTYHSGSVFSSGGSGFYSGTSSTTTRTKTQTILAKRFSPPDRKGLSLAFLCIFISLGLFIGFFLYHRDISGFDFDFRLNMMLWTGISFLSFMAAYYSIYYFGETLIERKKNPQSQKSYRQAIIYLIVFFSFMVIKRILPYYEMLESRDSLFWIISFLTLLIPTGIYLHGVLAKGAKHISKKAQPLVFLLAGSGVYLWLSIMNRLDRILEGEFWAEIFSFIMFSLLILGIKQILSTNEYNKNVYPGLYERWWHSWHCNKCGNSYIQRT